MMSYARRAIVCMLMVLVVAVCGHAQSTSSKESTASISGKVSLKGEGVSGVVVSLRTNENPGSRKLTNYRGVTDAKGEYRITNVPSGSYTVVPAAAALVVEDVINGERPLIVNKDETIENLDFSLTRGGVITGRVVDSDGRPVIEEEVYAFSGRDRRTRSGRADAITDDRGIYRIFALPPGDYTVAAGRDDFTRTVGRPRGGVYSRTYYPGIADPAQATVIQVSDGSEATNVDIVLGRPLTTHTASGRVVNGATGQPVPNVGYGVTHFASPTYSVTLSKGSVTNSRGEFKLEDLTPGKYSVSVRPEDGADWRAEDVHFEIVDQDVTGIVVRTGKGASVSGVVVLEGITDKALREQFRNARLIVSVLAERTQRSATNQAFASTLGQDGSFRVAGLPTGNAMFSLAAPPHFRLIRVERDGVIPAGSIEVKQGEDVTAVRIVVGYADASIRGMVVLENGSLPPNGRLFLWVKRSDNPNPRAIEAAAKIDTRGQFVLDDLFPGAYELTAGVMVQGSRTPLVQTKQEVVVSGGSTTNTTIKLNLNPPQPKP